MLLHGRGDRLQYHAAVADAGGAAIANQMEAQCLEVGQQAGVGEVLCYGARAGGQTRLHVGLDIEAALNCLHGQDACSNHHNRIGSVGATGDRGDGNRAVMQGCRQAIEMDRHVVDMRINGRLRLR